jgi:hypothetical protein
MAQAARRHITSKHASNNENAKTLIAAHRSAQAVFNRARSALSSISWPNRTGVTIAEIGPNCTAYDVGQLAFMAEQHISNKGLVGMGIVKFEQQIVGYRAALALLGGLYEEWRKQAGVEQVEAEDDVAYVALQSTHDALLSRLRLHAADAAQIAAYFASDEVNTGPFWRPVEVLKAIAGSISKRGRS